MFWGQHCSWLSTIYFSFHASHKARVFRECENKNMKIFTSVASIWYVEDSKIDFKNENTAHGNRLLLFYKSKIIEIEKDEYFSDNCKKYSHCSTNSKPNSAYCSSTNSHCVNIFFKLKPSSNVRHIVAEMFVSPTSENIGFTAETKFAS